MAIPGQCCAQGNKLGDELANCRSEAHPSERDTLLQVQNTQGPLTQLERLLNNLVSLEETEQSISEILYQAEKD